MKTGIHPELHDVVFVDSSTGDQFICKSTAKSKKTVKIDGKEYFAIEVETTSSSHPFYTGKQKVIKTGQVEKFLAKQKRAEEMAAQKVKKVKKGEEKEAAKASTEEKKKPEVENLTEKGTEEETEKKAEDSKKEEKTADSEK